MAETTDTALAPPDTSFALPRSRTALGRATDDLMAALVRGAPLCECLSEIATVEARLESYIDAHRYPSCYDDLPRISRADAEGGVATLDQIRTQLEADDREGAIALLVRESYTRDLVHVRLAYQAAMRGSHAV